MKKKALITGITGQDGSYLADFLLEKDYEVFGMIRRSSTETFHRIEHIINDIEFMVNQLVEILSVQLFGEDLISTSAVTCCADAAESASPAPTSSVMGLTHGMITPLSLATAGLPSR